MYIIEEGIDEKIPKILNLLPDRVKFDNKIHDLSDTGSKGSFIRFLANNFDPTPNAAYITWILKLVKIGNIRGMEDRTKVHDSLKKFTEIKNKAQFPAQHKDINRFKSFGDLAEVLDEFGDVKSKKEVIRIAREDGIELAEVNGQYKLYIVTKSEAAAKHFRNTQWCVKDPRHFDNYGEPYYYFTKDDQPHTLLHLDSDQCMDVQDRNVDLDDTQIMMMETEKITNYVIEVEGQNAISIYIKRVGNGYDDKIVELMVKSLYDLLERYKFDHVDVDRESVNTANTAGYFEARSFIPFDFSGFGVDIFNDRNFISLTASNLHSVGIYPDRLKSDDFSEDGISINLSYEFDDHASGIYEMLTSFLDTLRVIDDNYDSAINRFTDRFKDKMLDLGYIPSGWGSFKVRVLDNITKTTFKRATISTYRDVVRESHQQRYELGFFHDLNIELKSTQILRPPKMDIGQSPIEKLLSKFFKHVTNSVNQIYISIDSGSFEQAITFSYQPEYDESLTFEDYMRDFKIFRSLDKHYKEYIAQIDKFVDTLNSGTQTGDEEIPIFTLHSRKSPPEQGYFQFREQKITSFDKLYKRIKLL